MGSTQKFRFESVIISGQGQGVSKSELNEAEDAQI